MPLLIGAIANSTEYGTDACNINLIPDYVAPSERQEWVNLQEQLRLFQEEANCSNIVTNTTECKFNWKALLIHGLHLSGHIQQEYQKIHSLPSVSHQKSVPIKDTGISPYRYYEDIYSNSSGNYILHNDNTTLLNGDSTYEQDVYSEIVRAEYIDIMDKGPNTIDISKSLREHQYAQSSSNSYIEVDQEVTMPIVVATSTSLMSKGWRYCLGGLGIMLAGAGIYTGYEWVMDKIASTAKKEVQLPYDTEYEPQAAMLRGFGRSKYLGSPSKYDIGIRNIDFSDISISDLQLIESKIINKPNTNEPSENKFCITLDDLQYDNITAKDSKLGLQDAITSSMNRDFYNRYLHPHLVKALGNTDGDINTFNQYVYNNIINGLLKITFKTNLLSIGGISYLSTMKHFLYVIESGQLTHQDHARLRHIESNISYQQVICKDHNIDLSYNNFYNDTLASILISTTKDLAAMDSYTFDINFLLLRNCISNITINVLNELHDNNLETDYLLWDLIDCRNNISNTINEKLKHLDYNSQYTWNIVTSNIKSSINPKQISKTFYDIFASIIIYCRILPAIEDMKNINFNIQTLIQRNNILEANTENTLIAQNNKVEPNKLVATSTKAPVEAKDNNVGIVGLGAVPAPIIIPLVPFCIKCFTTSIGLTDNVELENIAKDTNELAESQSEEPHNTDSSSEEDKDDVPKMKEFLPIIYDTATPPIIAFNQQGQILDDIYHGRTWAVYSGFPVQDSSGVPDNILQVQIKIKNAEHWLEDTLSSVDKLLKSRYNNQENFRYLYKYFKGALGVESSTAINESLERMDMIIEKMVQYIQYSKSKNYTTFFVTSSSTVPVRGMRGYEHVSTLTADGIHTGAFVTRGDKSLIVISEFNQMTSFENKVHRIDKHHMYETLLHEVSHISISSEDIMYIEPSYGGRLPSADEGLNQFMQYINKNINTLDDSIYELTKRFMDTYNFKADKKALTRYLLEHDEVFRSNVIMTNADNIATFIRDLGARRSYNAPTPF